MTPSGPDPTTLPMQTTIQAFLIHHLLPTLTAAFLLLCLGLFSTILAIAKNRRIKRRLHEKEQELHVQSLQAGELQAQLAEEKLRSARLETQLTEQKLHSDEKLGLLEKAREELSLQFQSLAQRIFDEKSAVFSAQNKERLSALLQPFQEQMTAFRRHIDEIHMNDTKERVSLKEEILHLRDLNRRINEEAVNLTRALKGDRKLQGTWGELVLEKVLEQSGLRKGHEYETQESFRDRDNQLLRPDVIVHLPDGKDIIVDSKVSLVAWEQYVNCEDGDGRQTLLQRHTQAIRDHLVGLGNKDYADIKGLRSLDFVLMFMPVEAAFTAAFEHDDTLFAEAFARKIIVVSPTTLLAALRTIENLWRFEHQSKNAQEIAEMAGALYHKLCLFVEEMEKLGRQLGSASAAYDTAMNRLTHGRGNIISLAQTLPEMGVKVKRALPRTVVDASELGNTASTGESSIGTTKPH